MNNAQAILTLYNALPASEQQAVREAISRGNNRPDNNIKRAEQQRKATVKQLAIAINKQT